MRNLVCACTGVPRRDFEWLLNGDELSDADIVASLADFEFFTDFGEAFQYSNQMVATAGYIAGAVAAEAAGDATGNLTDDYMASLQARVLEPIGMTDTTLSFEDVEARGNYAVPHAQTLENTYVAQPLSLEKPLALMGSAGGHWSTLNDMAKYMITQLSDGIAPDGTRVVSAENLLETRKPQIAINANTSYGLGWMVSSYKGQPVVTHAGNTFGFTSEFTFLPEADLGIIVLTNGRATNLFSSSVTARLLELVFAQEPEMAANNDFMLERIAQQTAELEEQLGDTIDAAAVAPYLGTFRNDLLGELQVALVDGTLMLDAGEFRTELRPYADEASGSAGYLQMDAPLQGILYRFEQDADGNPAIILGGAAIEYTFEKVE
jgi:CubicO group peptidase (beta-lactamase class C family)